MRIVLTAQCGMFLLKVWHVRTLGLIRIHVIRTDGCNYRRAVANMRTFTRTFYRRPDQVWSKSSRYVVRELQAVANLTSGSVSVAVCWTCRLPVFVSAVCLSAYPMTVHSVLLKRCFCSFFHNTLKWWSIYAKLWPVVTEEIIIQNILTKYTCC